MKNLINRATILFLLLLATLIISEENKIAKSAEDICPVKIGMEVPSAIIASITG